MDRTSALQALAEHLAELYARAWRARANSLLFALGVASCDRDDILQDGFVTLLENLERVPNPEAYFLRVVRCRGIDRRRAKARRNEIELDFEASSPGPDPNDQIEIGRLLSGLKAGDRHFLLARFVLGKSHDELAAERGVTCESMRKKQLRTLDELRRRVRLAARPAALQVGG